MAGSFVRIFLLLWADVLVVYALFVMQNYLTDVWQLSFTHSAGILNVWGGICSILPVLFIYLAEAILGNFMMLVLSSIAYSLGIVCIFMSTPPVLADSTGTCKQYESKCIGDTQKVLLYTGMALVAVGVSDHQVSVQPFLDEQKKHQSDNFEIRSIFQLPGFVLVVLVPIIGAIALPYIKPWSIQFGIPAICTVVATILFLTGWCTYQNKPLQRSSPRVFSGTLWMVPIWMTFVVCGIVSSIGNTYFLEQANHMNRKIRTWNAPLQIFLLLFKFSKFVFGLLAGLMLSRSRKYGPLVGIALAMIFSVLCCVTAAWIEIKRRDVITSNGLLDKPDEDIPMSVYWLLFQFSLLAGHDSFLEKSVEAFHDYQASHYMKEYLGYITKGVSGLGFLCGVLSVYVVGNISESGGKPNWFQPTLNRSRLDKYYWVLAFLSSTNLVVFIFVITFYRIMNCCRRN